MQNLKKKKKDKLIVMTMRNFQPSQDEFHIKTERVGQLLPVSGSPGSLQPWNRYASVIWRL